MNNAFTQRAVPPPAARQLELLDAPAGRTPEALRDALGRLSGGGIRLTITRNRVSMVSIRHAHGAPAVRLDRAFLAAPEAVIVALARYLRDRSGAAWRVVRHYTSTILPDPGSPRRLCLATQGRFHDLAAIRERVNARHFGGQLRCGITWGRAGLRPRRRTRSRTIRFGSYERARDLVRINPLLDDPRVPADFMEYIVFHELLHAVVPAEPGARGHRYHHATFRVLERRFPDVARMRRLANELVATLAQPRN